MATNHVLVVRGEVDRGTGAWTHIWNRTAVLSCYVTNLDTPVIACSSDLITHVREAETIDPGLEIDWMILSRWPNGIDIQLIQIIAGRHNFTPFRERNLRHTRRHTIGVLFSDATGIAVPEFDYRVHMPSGNHWAIWWEFHYLSFGGFRDVNFLLSATWWVILRDPGRSRYQISASWQQSILALSFSSPSE